MGFKNDGLEKEPIVIHEVDKSIEGNRLPFENDSVEHTEILMKAISHFGYKLQINHAIQEMSELTKELTEYIGRETLQHKSLNFKELADEMADVEIMLEQLKMMFGNHDEVFDRKMFKLKRLRDRLNKNKGEK